MEAVTVQCSSGKTAIMLENTRGLARWVEALIKFVCILQQCSKFVVEQVKLSDYKLEKSSKDKANL